jgi:uncharacterized cupredoxin-like copper-binding protein
MRNERKRVAIAAVAFTVAVGGAAIGGVVARAQVAVPTVNVTLKEFKVTTSAKLKAGKVTLHVVNKGKIPHALKVAGPGVNAKTATLAPGKSANLTVSLKDGSTNLWCPISNHAALGMKMTAKIGTVAAGGGATGATGATGGTTGGTGATSGGGDGSSAGGEWG